MKNISQKNKILEAIISYKLMKTIILCGGMGTRLREETEYKPKPMVEIEGNLFSGIL